MKRTLRSRNSCTPIQNLFDKLMHPQFSELIEVVPPEIIKKLSKKKTLICEDLMFLQTFVKITEIQTQNVKKATKILKQKYEAGFDKYRKIEDKSTTLNNSYFDCLVNQQQFGRKMVKYESFPLESKENHKTIFQYKIEQGNVEDEPALKTTDNFQKFTDKRVQNGNQQKELFQINGKQQ